MRKLARTLTTLFFLLALGRPLIALAVSFSPVAEEREEMSAKGVKEKGDAVCLFQSGTADVRKEIHIDDILIVYRETGLRKQVPVGKISIVALPGDDFLKAVVADGLIMPGDIAKKGAAAALVLSSEDACK